MPAAWAFVRLFDVDDAKVLRFVIIVVLGVLIVLLVSVCELSRFRLLEAAG
jgi:hypothetical protein